MARNTSPETSPAHSDLPQLTHRSRTICGAPLERRHWPRPRPPRRASIRNERAAEQGDEPDEVRAGNGNRGPRRLSPVLGRQIENGHSWGARERRWSWGCGAATKRDSSTRVRGNAVRAGAFPVSWRCSEHRATTSARATDCAAGVFFRIRRQHRRSRGVPSWASLQGGVRSRRYCLARTAMVAG